MREQVLLFNPNQFAAIKKEFRMYEQKHKFDEPIEGLTYRQFLTEVYRGRITLIRELEAILGKKRTHDIIERYYTQQAIESCKQLVENQEKPLKTLDAVGEFFKRLKENPFAQMTQTDEFLESEPGKLKFCTKECLYADVFRSLDATDLGEIMLCNGDIATAEVFNPHLRLERHKTLMAGDEYCDFTYNWDE